MKTKSNSILIIFSLLVLILGVATIAGLIYLNNSDNQSSKNENHIDEEGLLEASYGLDSTDSLYNLNSYEIDTYDIEAYGLELGSRNIGYIDHSISENFQVPSYEPSDYFNGKSIPDPYIVKLKDEIDSDIRPVLKIYGLGSKDSFDFSKLTKVEDETDRIPSLSYENNKEQAQKKFDHYLGDIREVPNQDNYIYIDSHYVLEGEHSIIEIYVPFIYEAKISETDNITKNQGLREDELKYVHQLTSSIEATTIIENQYGLEKIISLDEFGATNTYRGEGDFRGLTFKYPEYTQLEEIKSENKILLSGLYENLPQSDVHGVIHFSSTEPQSHFGLNQLTGMTETIYTAEGPKVCDIKSENGADPSEREFMTSCMIKVNDSVYYEMPGGVTIRKEKWPSDGRKDGSLRYVSLFTIPNDLYVKSGAVIDGIEIE